MELDNVFMLLVYMIVFSIGMCVAAALTFIGRLAWEIGRHVLVPKLARPIQSNRETRPARRVWMVDQRKG